MDTLEKYYIFRENKLNNQINDKLTVKQSSIFDMIVHFNQYRGLLKACSKAVVQVHHSGSQ